MCTDITEHPAGDGKVYCCAVLDVFSRVVVGWSIADHMRTELVVDALGDGDVAPSSPGHDRALRPRRAIHLLGVRTPAA
ncbi:DDE-type integrase/transposase/recombinase [Enemella evansiae]|uniref:DDE-type integrase/transposase/recombinase n=1 Tax=Enemella evansiae TaxID=2016499 RepID=UPI003983AD17